MAFKRADAHYPLRFDHMYLDDTTSAEKLDFSSLPLGGDFRNRATLNSETMGPEGSSGVASLLSPNEHSNASLYDSPWGRKRPMNQEKSESGFGELVSGVIGGRFGRDIEGGTSDRSYFFWQLPYYRPYFDVTTDDVRRRIESVFKVWKGEQFWDGAETNSNNYPDMYGPCWAIVTLTLALIMSEGSASFLSLKWQGVGNSTSDGVSSKSSIEPDFHTGVDKASMALLISVCLVTVFPGLIWTMCYIYGAVSIRLTRLVSLSGYAAIAFIPFVLLCSIPNVALQWFSLTIAAAIASSFVLKHMQLETSDTLPNGARVSVKVVTIILYVIAMVVLKSIFFASHAFSVSPSTVIVPTSTSTVNNVHDPTVTLRQIVQVVEDNIHEPGGRQSHNDLTDVHSSRNNDNSDSDDKTTYHDNTNSDNDNDNSDSDDKTTYHDNTNSDNDNSSPQDSHEGVNQLLQHVHDQVNKVKTSDNVKTSDTLDSPVSETVSQSVMAGVNSVQS